MASTNIHLNRSTTSFHVADRGLLCTTQIGPTTTRFYIPKVRTVKVTVLGRNTTILVGTVLVLSMVNSLWAEWEDGIMTAALGQGWKEE